LCNRKRDFVEAVLLESRHYSTNKTNSDWQCDKK